MSDIQVAVENAVRLATKVASDSRVYKRRPTSPSRTPRCTPLHYPLRFRSRVLPSANYLRHVQIIAIFWHSASTTAARIVDCIECRHGAFSVTLSLSWWRAPHALMSRGSPLPAHCTQGWGVRAERHCVMCVSKFPPETVRTESSNITSKLCI